MRKIAEASKPALQAKNLVSSQADSTTLLKVAKNTNETSTSPLPPSSTTVSREQQTTTPIVPTIDPALITTIHANKGAIDTIRGQIVELRHDVDHLRKQINNRKRSTAIPNETSPPNLPSATSQPLPANNTRPVPKTNANNDNANSTSVSHHHHHHHHVEQPGPTGRSSVCIII